MTEQILRFIAAGHLHAPALTVDPGLDPSECQVPGARPRASGKNLGIVSCPLEVSVTVAIKRF